MKRLLIEYQVFLSRIKEIQVLLKKADKNICVEKIEQALSKPDQETVDYINFLKSLSGSQVIYNAVIISLYGCYENYIDNLLGVYLDIMLENVSTYDQLPEKLKKKYRAKFGEYLTNPQRFNKLDLDLSKEVSNYNELLQSNLSGSMSKKFAIAHSGNLHVQEIFDLINVLGIEDSKDKVLDSYMFKKFHLENGMDELEFNTKRARNKEDFFLPIEILVEQRNSVAHSWNVEDRITFREINDVIIPFLRMICACVCRLCVCSAFNLNSDHQLFENQQPIKIIDNRIVCFNNQNKRISIGDYIIYESDEIIKVACIKNMQINRRDILHISEEDSKDIGLEIDNAIRETDKLKMVINVT